VAPEEVRVLVSERNLTVTGQRTATAPDRLLSQHCERHCGTFHRAVNFPRPVDPHQARAEYCHGVCRVSLPRKPQTGDANQAPADVEGTRYVIRVAVL
jgi:HSP20 family molecular chaperone IbpA